MKTLFKKHIYLPQEHGAWVFLFSPLCIGLCVAGVWQTASTYLVLTAVCAFLAKNPLTLLVKIFSGRRSRQELTAVLFWLAIYGGLTVLGGVGLWWEGAVWLVSLGLPAVPVLAWYLWLVSKRSERRQIGLDIVGSGVLALTAPAAYWVGIGKADGLGWWLWVLCWFQSAASIVYAALRLQQREWKTRPPMPVRLQAGGKAIAYAGFNLLLAGVLGWLGVIPLAVGLAFLPQFLEAIYGTRTPAIGLRPATIGFRQLAVSGLFTVLFVVGFGWG